MQSAGEISLVRRSRLVVLQRHKTTLAFLCYE